MVVDAAVPAGQLVAVAHRSAAGGVLRRSGRFAGMASPAAILDGLASAFPELDEFARKLRRDAASSDIERETDRQTNAWKAFVSVRQARASATPGNSETR